MLIEHRGKSPRIDESAYVAPTAVICADVTIGAGSRVLFGAVLTAEAGAIEIGRDVIVMENALIRGRQDFPVMIGDSSPQAMRRYSELFGAHAGDRVIE